jgi:hypothetical protein
LNFLADYMNGYLIELLMTGVVEFVIRGEGGEPVWCIVRLEEYGFDWESGDAMGTTCNGFDAIWSAIMQGASAGNGHGLEMVRRGLS